MNRINDQFGQKVYFDKLEIKSDQSNLEFNLWKILFVNVEGENLMKKDPKLRSLEYQGDQFKEKELSSKDKKIV